MKVRNFNYNGFFGTIHPGYTNYTAEFKEWTTDPGIAVCTCSDDIVRIIPSFALDEFHTKGFPQQKKDRCFIWPSL